MDGLDEVTMQSVTNTVEDVIATLQTDQVTTEDSEKRAGQDTSKRVEADEISSRWINNHESTLNLSLSRRPLWESFNENKKTEEPPVSQEATDFGNENALNMYPSWMSFSCYELLLITLLGLIISALVWYAAVHKEE